MTAQIIDHQTKAGGITKKLELPWFENKQGELVTFNVFKNEAKTILFNQGDLAPLIEAFKSAQYLDQSQFSLVKRFKEGKKVVINFTVYQWKVIFDNIALVEALCEGSNNSSDYGDL